MTRQQIEAGEGRYSRGGTTILQHGNEDVFDTAPQGDPGWVNRPGWHIAGSASRHGKVEWCDLR